MPYQRDANGRKRVTLIEGDGIGPEVVRATRRVIEAAGVPIAWEVHEAGAKVFERGLPSGVPPETVASTPDTRVALEGPLEEFEAARAIEDALMVTLELIDGQPGYTRAQGED